MELGKSEIAVLSRFFRDENKLLLSSQGKLKRWLEQHFDLYHKSKDKLRIDIELLYPRLNIRAALPPEQDRISITEHVNNDKLAEIKPNEHYVLVKSPEMFKLAG